jgi:2-oxoisovalerate dehydrogenase E1 component beta subunit
MLKEKEGIEAEVIDLRTLVPLDTTALAQSARKTGRCAVVVQSPLPSSFAEHVAFEVQRQVFNTLKKPVQIISAYNVPPPMAACLENENIPSPERIFKAVVQLFQG